MQDSKSSAWDRRGVISSIRPDKLSYVVQSDGRYFTVTTYSIGHTFSFILISIYISLFSSFPSSLSLSTIPKYIGLSAVFTYFFFSYHRYSTSPQWHHYLSATDKALWTTTENRCSLRNTCLLYTSPSPRDRQKSRMPSSA